MTLAQIQEYNLNKLRKQKKAWADRNKDKVKQSKAKYYLSHKDSILPKQRAKSKVFYQKHKIRERLRSRKKYYANRERILLYTKRYFRLHPNKRKEYKQRYVNRLKNAKAFADLLKLKQWQNESIYIEIFASDKTDEAIQVAAFKEYLSLTNAYASV